MGRIMQDDSSSDSDSSVGSVSPELEGLRAEKVAATVAIWQRCANGAELAPRSAEAESRVARRRFPAPAPEPAPAPVAVRRELTYTDGGDSQELRGRLRIAEEKEKILMRERDALHEERDVLKRENAAIHKQATAEIAGLRHTPTSRFLTALACWTVVFLLALSLGRQLPVDFVRDQAH